MTVKSSEKKKKKGSVPTIIWVLLGIVAIFSTINLIQDTRSWGGIRPFGQLQDTFAQFVRTAPNTGTLVTNLSTTEGFEDQTDRCQIIDPNRPDIKTAGELNAASDVQLLGENIGGMNIGTDFTNGYDRERDNKIIEYGKQLGMSYNISIYIDYTWDSVKAATEFIENNYEQGMIPIVRLCYVEGCSFDENKIIDFYLDISGIVNVPFIAMVGPNEPGTGDPSELSGFLGGRYANFSGDSAPYSEIISLVNKVAKSLQDRRVVNGGNMLLTPGAFNLSNAENRDTYQYLYNTAHEVIDPELYDYLMGNVYAQGYPRVTDPEGSGQQIPQAYAWYRYGDALDGQGIGNYADENGIPVILTEFSVLREGRSSEDYIVDEAIETFDYFCKDDTVEGVLFFRAALNDDGTKLDDFVEDKHALTQAQHAQIINDCQKASPYKDWAWANCNFDSCQYEHTYDARSVATVCGTEDAPQPGDGKPALKLVCGDGACSTRAIGTIDVGMPIKHFGGNSSLGTPQLPYSSVCAEVARSIYDGDYDALNQFAGILTTARGTESGNADYAMPWLGSAINCASQLLLYTPDFARFNELDLSENPHIGSERIQTVYEQREDDLNGSPWEAYLGIPGRSVEDVNPDRSIEAIQDEKTICAILDSGEEYCFDKVGESQQIQQLQQYDPFKSVVIWEDATCTDTKYVANEANFIYGPEVQVSDEQTVHSVSSAQICYEFARRNLPEEKSNIVTGHDYPNLVEDPTEDNLQAITPSCQVNNTKIITKEVNDVIVDTIYCSAAGVCTSEQALEGECNINPRYTECFEYLNEGENSNHEIYYKANENIFPSIPQYDIPGMYDALYRLYQRVQSNLSSKDLKIVFRENIGMQTKVNAKIRDASRPLSDSLNVNFPSGEFRNLYAQETQSCSLQDNAYSYEHLLAKNAPIKTQYQYYEWLGYLDILQEISVAYLNDNYLSDAEITTNPFFGTGDFPTSEREFIVTPGSSHKALSFPIYTCDELEVRTYVTQEVLGIDISDQKITCLTDAADERFEDELGEFLCSKGYAIEGLCENYCPAIGGNTSSGATACPAVEGYCTQGPKATIFSHSTLNAVDIKSLTQRGDQDVIAPFDGEVVAAYSAFSSEGVPFSYCQGSQRAGGGIWYQGVVNGQLVTLFMYHVYVTPQDEQTMVGKRFTAGEKITVMSSYCSASNPGACSADVEPGNTCMTSDHIHIEIAKNEPPFDRSRINQDGDILGLLYDWGCREDTIVTPSCKRTSPVTLPPSIDPPPATDDPPPDSEINQCSFECIDVDVRDSSVQEVNTNNAQPGGGAVDIDNPNFKYVTIDKQADFTATRADNTFESMDAFAARTDFAINTNLYSNTSGPQGLFGADGSFVYGYPINPSTQQVQPDLFRFAFVEFINGIPDTNDLQITHTSGNFAVIDIRPWGRLSEAEINSLIDEYITGNVKWAITGSGVYDGTPAGISKDDDYGSINTEFRGRTIMGWDGNGDIVMGVLDSANLNNIVDAFEASGISVGTILDGGGSSTLYSSKGFPTTSGTGDYYQPDTVYVPEGSGIRPVIGYFGAKGGVVQQCYSAVRPIGEEPIPGVLTCNADIANVNDEPTIENVASIGHVLLRSYNLDDNASYTWIGIEEVEEPQEFQDAMIAKLGSREAYEQDRAERIRVTNLVRERAVELGISPHFALTLWVEETGASALGVAGLGCLGFRDGMATPTGEMPFDGSVDNMLAHMDEQIRCLATYVEDFPDFLDFMCTYSGEVGYPNCTGFTNNPNFPRNICLFYTEFE